MSAHRPALRASTPAKHQASGSALEVRDLRFAYPDGHQALDGVSFGVGPGERLAILGPNGSGKSTLCLALAGILRPQHGSITIDGHTVTDKTADKFRGRVGVVFQDPDDMLFMPTVWQDVAFGPANLGQPEDELNRRVQEALDRVGLSEHARRPPHHLSLGQRKRAATAAVLSMEPSLLVLDEPTSNLDPRGRRELTELLERLDQTILVVTHDLPFAFRLCGQAVVLDRGRSVVDRALADLLSQPETLERHALELPEGFVLDPVAREAARRPGGQSDVAAEAVGRG